MLSAMRRNAGADARLRVRLEGRQVIEMIDGFTQKGRPRELMLRALLDVRREHACAGGAQHLERERPITGQP